MIIDLDTYKSNRCEDKDCAICDKFVRYGSFSRWNDSKVVFGACDKFKEKVKYHVRFE